MDTNSSELHKDIKDLQKDVKTLTADVIRLISIHEHNASSSSQNSQRLTIVESELLVAKGSINILKAFVMIFGGIFVTSMISFCVWIVSSQHALEQSHSKLAGKMSIIFPLKSKGEDSEMQ